MTSAERISLAGQRCHCTFAAGEFGDVDDDAIGACPDCEGTGIVTCPKCVECKAPAETVTPFDEPVCLAHVEEERAAS